jgi:hypothetical protein
MPSPSTGEGQGGGEEAPEIQSFQEFPRFWIPACEGMTTFYEAI